MQCAPSSSYVDRERREMGEHRGSSFVEAGVVRCSGTCNAFQLSLVRLPRALRSTTKVAAASPAPAKAICALNSNVPCCRVISNAATVSSFALRFNWSQGVHRGSRACAAWFRYLPYVGSPQERTSF